MKTQNFIFTIAFLCISTYSFSQTSMRPDPVTDNQFGWLREVAAKPAETKGSVYLNEEWIKGTIVLTSGTEIKDVPIKYDLKNDILELQTKNEVKIVPKYLLKSFEINGVIETLSYLNGSQLKVTTLSGIFNEVVKGKVSLYIKPELEMLQPNYNVAMDVGEKSVQYLKKERIYLVTDKEAVDVTKANKKILKYFGEKADEVESFAKSKKLSYKEKGDLTLIVEEYNRLVKS